MNFYEAVFFLKKIGIWRCDITETGIGQIEISVPRKENINRLKLVERSFFPAALYVSYKIDTSMLNRRKKHTYNIY